MKTDIYEIQGNESDFEYIEKEVNKIATYNDLDKKDSLHLLLLAEELLGMEKGILGFGKGEFHIENTGKTFSLFLHAKEKIDLDVQDTFINMSKNQKNEAYKGFKGKINLIVDTFLYTPTGPEIVEFNSYAVNSATISSFSGADYEMTWALSNYRTDVTQNTPEWDELEHSILASIADDIIVGTRNNSFDIIVIKKFD